VKISDGNWLIQENFRIIYPLFVFDLEYLQNEIKVYVCEKDTKHRANQLDCALFTVTFTAPLENIIGVKYEHHLGAIHRGPDYQIFSVSTPTQFREDSDFAYFSSGNLTVRISKYEWKFDFLRDGQRLTGSGEKSSGYMTQVPANDHFMFERLDLGVGENIYGLGERFTALIKNGQVIETWNRDGGTSTEQAYKNIPFYLSSKGYGVFVNHPEQVSFEIAAEKVSKAQFSVAGERLEYYVIGGAGTKEVLNLYTNLTGKPALPPAWTFGLWLTTSFTTDYDESTVTSFIEGMAEREIPLHVFHFDCFWMKPFQWCNFTWDADTFPDPEGMLARLKQKGLKICVWINPYIGQRSPLFKEGMEQGFLLQKANGDVWQWDRWQAGQAIVDFSNPQACQWYCRYLQKLMRMGVDCFKTDFGERIPTDVVWFDGSDPYKMHNYYAYLYNQVVFDCIRDTLGEDEAVVFARAAAVGSQQFPVHWGGDCDATYESMAESLRGGLSLGLSGFGYWSHDIGGFENTASADVYKRWCAFGLLSSHSRLHGSSTYRVPWHYDDDACDVVRFFIKLKCRLMPYLYRMAKDAARYGLPIMRAMLLEFPDDPTCEYLDLQYMLGDCLLVAPVFNQTGEAKYYLPAGNWTHLMSNQTRSAGWHQEDYDFLSLPLFVRDNTLLAMGPEASSRPDYPYHQGTTFHLFHLEDGHQVNSEILDLQGEMIADVSAQRCGNLLTIRSSGNLKNWSICLRNIPMRSIDSGAITKQQAVIQDSVYGPVIFPVSDLIQINFV
jgi:alpha-D-xyloside xylohydrolase